MAHTNCISTTPIKQWRFNNLLQNNLQNIYAYNNDCIILVQNHIS